MIGRDQHLVSLLESAGSLARDSLDAAGVIGDVSEDILDAGIGR